MLEITHNTLKWKCVKNNSELSQLRLKFIIGHFVDRSLTPMFKSLSNQLKDILLREKKGLSK